MDVCMLLGACCIFVGILFIAIKLGFRDFEAQKKFPGINLSGHCIQCETGIFLTNIFGVRICKRCGSFLNITVE